jgi:hypothetical protein
VSEKLNSRECQNCKGTGNVFDGWEDTSPCPDCGGSGSTPSAPQAAKPEPDFSGMATDEQYHKLCDELAPPSSSTERDELVEAAREMLDKIEDWRQQLTDAASDGNWGWVARIIPAMWEESEPLRRALAAQAAQGGK